MGIEKQKPKCRCCKWNRVNEDGDTCDACRPLVEKFTKEILKKYDTKIKIRRVSGAVRDIKCYLFSRFNIDSY